MKIGLSLRTKLIISLGLVLFLIFSFNTYYTVNNEYQKSIESLRVSSEAFSKLSTENMVENYKLYYESGFYKFKEVTEDMMSLNSDIQLIQIYDIQGKTLFDSGELSEGKYSLKEPRIADDNILSSIRKVGQTENEISYGGDNFIEIIEPYIEEWGRHDYSVRYLFSTKSTYEKIEEYSLNVYMLAFMIFFISVALIFAFFEYFVSAPLSKISEGVELLGKGNLKKKVDISSNDEIGKLSQNFNKMSEDIMEYRREIASHAKNLESEVKVRTMELDKSKQELEKKVDELERFSKLSVGRELKMVELKKRIKELEGGTKK